MLRNTGSRGNELNKILEIADLRQKEALLIAFMECEQNRLSQKENPLLRSPELDRAANALYHLQNPVDMTSFPSVPLDFGA